MSTIEAEEYLNKILGLYFNEYKPSFFMVRVYKQADIEMIFYLFNYIIEKNSEF